MQGLENQSEKSRVVNSIKCQKALIMTKNYTTKWLLVIFEILVLHGVKKEVCRKPKRNLSANPPPPSEIDYSMKRQKSQPDALFLFK